jgi:hypothetical protein
MRRGLVREDGPPAEGQAAWVALIVSDYEHGR